MDPRLNTDNDQLDAVTNPTPPVEDFFQAAPAMPAPAAPQSLEEQVVAFESEPSVSGQSAFQGTVPGDSTSSIATRDLPSSNGSTIASGGLSVPPKKSKKALIIGLATVLVLCLVGGGAVYAYTSYQSPENVIVNAMGNALSVRQGQTKTTVTSDYAYDAGGMSIQFKSLTFTTGTERSPEFDANADLSMVYNKTPVSLKASVMANADGVLYFKVTNIKSALKTVMGDTFTMTKEAESYLDTIDGKWAKYTLAELKQDSPEYGKVVQCSLDVYKNHKDDKAAVQQIVDVYQKNSFVVVKSTVAAKDGNVGYVVDVDSEKSKAFSKALEDTALSKELNACSPDAKSTGDSITSALPDTTSTSDGPTTTVTVWISEWSHELRAIDVKVTGIRGNDEKSYSVTSHTDIDFTVGASMAAPTDAMPAKSWVEAASKFIGTLFEQ